jgi:hypothetical protein
MEMAHPLEHESVVDSPAGWLRALLRAMLVGVGCVGAGE